jgi:hypothetical protein
MTSSALIRSARKLITNRHNWISNDRDICGKQAADAHGNEVRADHETAVKFSLDGALRRAADMAGEHGYDDHFQAVQYLLRMKPKRKSIAEINDNCSHQQILDLMDRAAAALSIEGRIAA